jgi:hypothetical protein
MDQRDFLMINLAGIALLLFTYHQAKLHNHYGSTQNFSFVQSGNKPIQACPTCGGH